ncbi:ATP-grasp domain-containing protein [bacterium]|nr:ATP-grasp domain-containing protein [bacterium]
MSRDPHAPPLSGVMILAGPYVSADLRASLREHRLPVFCTSADVDPAGLGPGLLDAAAATALVRAGARVLTNSENALDWLVGAAAGTPLAAWVAACKDKARTRELLRPLYPDFRFRTLATAALPGWEPADMPFPFVIKPAVGFFSLGVHVVRDRDDWRRVQGLLADDLASTRGQYPDSVLDPARLLVEEVIVGDEYAIDAWYDDDGRAVITNILHHPFAHTASVSDRVYTTSVALLTRWLHPFTTWLEEVGALTGVRGMPVHVEVRVRPDGRIVPIEINPQRYGGWCTTADLARHAWGFDPYASFLRDERPDWPAVCRDRDDRSWSIVVLDNGTGVPGADVKGFDFDGLAARFARVLDCRPVDWRRYPLFGFLFVETPAGRESELAAILADDLRAWLA